MAQQGNGCAVFRIKQEQFWFINGSISLELCNATVQRSPLLCHFKEETESDAEVPLALSMHSLQAWITCVDLHAQDQILTPGQYSFLKDLSDYGIAAGLVVRCSHHPGV